jgi:transcriptional regulator with GAF, ATPase, and Fis domain
VVRVKGARPFRLKEGKCVVGSASTCDVVVREPGVSRAHVELEIVPEGVRVRDLGSRNGTFYLGQRVEQMVLSLGATIAVGATPLTIDADTEGLGSAVFAEDTFRGMVGASVAMRRVFGTLVRLEGSLVTVLIGGESGVGKELIAHALHEGSPVAGGPIIVVNCGAIPKDLVASELFGHKKGAFTGAVDNRKGAFECADGGTLFLDEIGELPLDIQPMLLRALESGEIRPVGFDQARKVHVRVVAATNRDLEEEVRAGRFREDLFYRLAVVRLYVPPLRERPEDIEPLARRFAQQSGLRDVPPHVLEQLKARSWPGNVRELRNAVQAFAALGSLPEPVGANAAALDLSLGDLVDLNRPYAAQKEELADRFTKIYLQRLIARTGGNQTAAAKIAGLDRSYLGRLLVKHGLSKG